MAKKKEKSANSVNLTGEELAVQLGINYETIMRAQANIREIQSELNRRNQKLEEKKE